MGPADDCELVDRAARQLERYLELSFGCAGRGLRAQIVQARSLLAADGSTLIPPSLIKILHDIATIRNRVMHEGSFEGADDREAFASEMERCSKALALLHSVHQAGLAPEAADGRPDLDGTLDRQSSAASTSGRTAAPRRLAASAWAVLTVGAALLAAKLWLPPVDVWAPHLLRKPRKRARIVFSGEALPPLGRRK